MNPGGEPERDDFGLPPVDIEIPDDARELDRDVQAYRREQRAQRRRLRLRRRRLHGPLSGDGMVMPLLAGCLIFALIAAVLLTVFAATGDVLPKAAAPRTALSTTPPGTTAPAGTAITPVRGLLPDATVEIHGKNVSLRALSSPSALAVVPATCSCTKALQQLIVQAARYRVTVYLVATAVGIAGLQRIAASRPAVQVADDRQHVLATAYQVSGLTVILVHADGSLALARGLQPGLQLQSEFLGLRQSAGPTVSPSA